VIGERKRSEIGMQAIRAGDIVGDHTVMFGGLGESWKSPIEPTAGTITPGGLCDLPNGWSDRNPGYTICKMFSIEISRFIFIRLLVKSFLLIEQTHWQHQNG